MDNYSLSDIRAATDHDDDGFSGQGGWFWIVVLFLFMFGFGGNGFGRNNDALTRADLCQTSTSTICRMAYAAFRMVSVMASTRRTRPCCKASILSVSSCPRTASLNRTAAAKPIATSTLFVLKTTRTPARSLLRFTTKVSRLVLSSTAIRCRLFGTRLLRRIRNCRLLTSSCRNRLRTQL